MTDRPSPEKLLKSAWGTIPHFQCADVHRTVDFYKNKLRFNCDKPDDYDMCSVFAGTRHLANIYIFEAPAEEVSPSAAGINMGTTQLEAYYAWIVEQGVQISVDIADQPWGYRQFEIKDPDGNRLQFFRFLEGGNPGDND